ncbi:MAG: TonB-dependent receptor [Ginsengibacter sp.]
MKYIATLIFIFFLGSNLIEAQVYTEKSEDDVSTKTLNEIIIQNSRIQIPFSKQNRDITIIDREIIKSLPVKSVPELLLYVAGVDVRQRGPWGTQADIGIDGGTFDQTLVLLNGIRITDPQTGHNMMNIPVSTDAIERIEILKGAAARIYGIDALNGAINIITRQPQHTGTDLNMYAGSSFQKNTSDQKIFGGYGLDASASFAGDKTKHFISMSHAQSSGYRYNTAFDNEKIFYQNNIDLGKRKSLSFMGGYVYNNFGANGFYAAPADIESKETVRTGIVGVSAILPVKTYWTLRPRISYRYNHDDYIFIRHNPAYYENIHTTNVLDAELNNTFYSGIGDFGVGLEGRNEAINSNSLGKHSRMNYGVFGEYSINKIRKLLINIGAYGNYNSDYGWQLLPGIDIGYDVHTNFRLFANAGTGQRLPTYTDLYYKGPGNIGNDQLKPEHSFYSEMGMKYNTGLLNASLSFFHKNTSDFIDWVKDNLTDPWQPQNFQKINTNGISFSADYRLLNQDHSSDFSLVTGLSYTWLHPKIINSEKPDKISQYALENLRNQVAAHANLTYLNKYQFILGAKYEERIHYKQYLLLDTRIAATFKILEVYADVNNLTNVSYVEAGAVPMVGRWATLGLKWKWR